MWIWMRNIYYRGMYSDISEDAHIFERWNRCTHKIRVNSIIIWSHKETGNSCDCGISILDNCSKIRISSFLPILLLASKYIMHQAIRNMYNLGVHCRTNPSNMWLRSFLQWHGSFWNYDANCKPYNSKLFLRLLHINWRQLLLFPRSRFEGLYFEHEPQL